MSKEQKRLGRGLSSLISSTFTNPSPPVAAELPAEKPHVVPISAEVDSAAQPTPSGPNESVSTQPLSGVQTLPVHALIPHRNQPRQVFEPTTIGQLAASIARSGVVQPLVVRPIHAPGQPEHRPEQYEIVAGERRWRAAKAAGLAEVPVVIRELDDESAIELALIENIQREDLNAMDRSAAYLAYAKRYELSPEDIARRLGEDRTTVVNYLRLQELPEEVKELVRAGSLSMGHARALLSISGHDARVACARRIVQEGLSVRAVEDLARRHKEASPNAPAQASSAPQGNRRSAHVADLEQRLQHAVGTKVRIQEGRKKGQGKIVIEYYSLDDFDRITGRLGLRDD